MKKTLTMNELKQRLGPLVLEALQDQLGNTIQQEVRQHLEQVRAAGPSTNYTQQILQGRDGGQPRSLRGKRDLSPGIRTFARLGLATALGQGDRAATLDAARRLDCEDELKKALEAGSTAGGGALLQEPTADEVIEVLRGMSIVRRAGPREIEIPRGTLRTPRIDIGVSSGYVGEGMAIPASDIQTGAVSLVAKKLATLVILTNELSEFGTSADVDTIIADDMLASISETEDTAFLEGTGTQNEPLGIINQVDAGQKFNSTGSTVTAVVDDLRTIMNLLLNADVPMTRPAWLMAPRTLTFLQTLLDANNNFVFRQEVEASRLFNAPVFSSTHVPINLGAGNDESRIYFVDMSEVVVGDVRQVALERSNQATATIDGVLTSLFETDRSAIRVRMWNDLALRHDVGASVMEAVQWGA